MQSRSLRLTALSSVVALLMGMTSFAHADLPLFPPQPCPPNSSCAPGTPPATPPTPLCTCRAGNPLDVINGNEHQRESGSLAGLLGMSPLSSCTAADSGAMDHSTSFVPGFGTLRLDANPEKEGITIYDEKGQPLDAAARLSKKIVGNSSGGERRIPRAIRATWRTGDFRMTGEGTWVGGTLMGDYTTTVAERIPREVFEFMRKNGGSLRLKIRVVDGAVLVGWDVEKYVPVEGWKPGDGDSGFHYYMAGGDFREDRVYNGKVVEAGWEHLPPAGSTAPGLCAAIPRAVDAAAGHRDVGHSGVNDIAGN